MFFFLIVTPFIKKTVTGWELMTLYDLLPFPGRFVLEDSCEEKKKRLKILERYVETRLRDLSRCTTLVQGGFAKK